MFSLYFIIDKIRDQTHNMYSSTIKSNQPTYGRGVTAPGTGAYNTTSTNNRMTASVPMRGSDSSPSIEVNFYTEIRSIHTIASDYNNLLIKQLEEVYSSFIKLDGKSGKTSFIIGFLLIQEAISQKSHDERNKLINITLEGLNSLVSLAKINMNEKSSLKSFRVKISEFYNMILRKKDELSPALDERGGVAKFLCEHMKVDKEFSLALMQMGRWVLVDILTRNNWISSKRGVYNKLTEKGWEDDELFSREFFEVLTTALDFRMVVVSTKSGRMKETIFNEKAKLSEAHVLEYTSLTKSFKAILYKSSDFLAPVSNQEDILTRKERPKQSEPNGGSHIEQQNVQAESAKQQCRSCSICHLEIVDTLVFTNEYCRHNYCLYCLQEAGEPNVSLCYLKVCPARLDRHELKRFLQSCAKIEGNKPTSLNVVPDEGSIINQPQNFPTFSDRNTMMQDSTRLNSSTNLSSARINSSTSRLDRSVCNMCPYEVGDEKNPSFVNKSCGHSFCASWLKGNAPIFSGNCFVPRCPQEIHFDKFREFLVQNNITNIKIRCDICSKSQEVAKSFANYKCNHKICLGCTEKLRSNWCPKMGCNEVLNEEELSNFKESLILQEENKNLSKTVVTCKICHDQAEIFSSASSKSDYWKCQKCSATHCFQHGGLMSSCMCHCPECLSTLSDNSSTQSKYCAKCSITYCMKCKKEHKGRTTCPCIEEETAMSTSMSTAVIKPSVGSLSMGTAMIKTANTSMNSSQKRKLQENICSQCNDFRDHPEFLKLKCGHKLCEYCIILKRKDYLTTNKITCTICHL